MMFFKIETCVITEGLFIINQAQPLSLTISGARFENYQEISGMPVRDFSESKPKFLQETFQPLKLL